MPALDDKRPCSECSGTQTVVQIGRAARPIPRQVNPGEDFGTTGHLVWRCDRDPMHVTRVEERSTLLKPCTIKGCAGPMFYTKRLAKRPLAEIGVEPRRMGKGYDRPELGTGWQCFENPDHIEET
jgi:hypothetical protein